MVAKNDITGDAIQTKTASQSYCDNYDTIFRKNKQTETVEDRDTALEDYIRQAQEIWNDSCTSPRKK
jgi:hypothetical protein